MLLAPAGKASLAGLGELYYLNLTICNEDISNMGVLMKRVKSV